MAAELGFTLKIDGIEKTITNVTELQKTIKELTTQLKGADLGSQAFEEYSEALKKAKAEFREFRKDNLAVKEVKDQFTSLGGGVTESLQAAGDSLELFGLQTEGLSAITGKASMAMQIANSALAISELQVEASVARKMIVEKLSIATTETATGVTKLWNAALKASPIFTLLAVITAVVGGIALLVNAMGEETDAAKAEAEAQEAVADAYKASASAAADATQKVNKVSVAFKMAEEGTISQSEALHTYNTTLGDSLGKTDDFTTAQKKFVDKGPAYIEMVRSQAIALELYKVAAQKSAEAATADLEDQTSWWEKIKGGLMGVAGAGYIAAKQVENTNGKISELQASADAINKKGEEIEKKSREAAKKAGVMTPEEKAAADEKEKRDKEAADKAKAAREKALASSKKYKDEQAKLLKESQDNTAKLKSDFDVQSVKDEEERAMAALKATQKNEYKQLQKKISAKDNSVAVQKALHEELEALQMSHGKAIVDLLDEQSKARQAQADKDREEQKAQAEKDLKAAEDLEKAKSNAKSNAKKNTREIELQENLQRAEDEQAKIEAQLEIDLENLQTEEDAKAVKLAEDRDNQLISQEEWMNAQHELEQTYRDKRTDAEDKAAEESSEIEKIKSKNVEGIIRGSIDAIAELMGKHTAAYKAIKVSETIIDTIRGGVSAFTGMVDTFPGPWGIALGAVAAAGVVASGYANVKKILAVKADGGGDTGGSKPQGSTYARGGILRGPSHANGGIATPFGEMEGGEAIINKNSTAMHMGLLSAINQDGGGRSLSDEQNTRASSGPLSSPVIKTYVVATEMTSAQEAQDRVDRMARL